MSKLTPLLAVLLAGCASAPEGLSLIKNSVDSRMEYVHYVGYIKPTGLNDNQGNCVAFAAAYYKEALAKGIDGHITTCSLPNGKGHAVFDSSEYRLDNREPYVGLIRDSECK